MKIVIAGAGAVGFHLAELMSKENQDITLIDRDDEVLAHASNHLDVLTIKGDASSTAIMESAGVSSAQLFIAVTTSEKTNLLLAILAKDVGAKRTIARITNSEYLEPRQKERFKKLGVDELISPTQLAAQEILRLLERASFTDLFEFEKGRLSVVGFTLDTSCPLINQSIEQIDRLNDDFIFRGIALLRGEKTIIPRGNTVLRKGDHLYIATRKKHLDQAMRFVGEKTDAFIALTPNAETNIITSLTAEQLGVYKTIALVDNVNYTHISQHIGIDTIINKKLIAANSIFRFIRKGKVKAIASLHGVDAEIIEFVIHKSNRILKYPIRDLHFPEKSIIAGVIREEKSYLPNGDFRFELDDKVIVLALPEAIHQVEEIFK